MGVKGNLSVVWLNLANAYGSILHRLLQLTLTKHNIPRNHISDFHTNFRMRASSGTITSRWDEVEIVIITGCSMSEILFALAMNMLTMSAELECIGNTTKSVRCQPAHRAFTDDHTVTTE